MRFWVDEVPLHAASESQEDGARVPPVTSQSGSCAPGTTDQQELGSLTRETAGGNHVRGSPDFGGGVDYHDTEEPKREHFLSGDATSGRELFPKGESTTPPRGNQARTPPEEQIPKQCSLHSMEPLREWFCKGADMTSAAEYEAALCKLEYDPPDIRQCEYSGGEMDSLLIRGSQIPSHDR